MTSRDDLRGRCGFRPFSLACVRFSREISGPCRRPPVSHVGPGEVAMSRRIAWSSERLAGGPPVIRHGEADGHRAAPLVANECDGDRGRAGTGPPLAMM